ncbi:MAG TPA: YdeI/OmpD-associated family protein [Gemmatimonadales bacterium]|nr:YdeI/OmpD-associated family protein [Gemmatimonadales bacterium]
MGKRSPLVDAYIARSQPFARPILEHLREVVHGACPDVVEEMKWSMPHFTHHGMLAGMAAFKEHCSFGFWKAKLIMEQDAVSRDAMGHFGCIRSLDDLPSKRTLAGYVKKAARLNEEGVKILRAPRAKSPKPVSVPADLAAALRRSRRARETFESFSPSHKREYIEWITEAKRAETREKRLATTIEWLEEGKPRNWKYQKS